MKKFFCALAFPLLLVACNDQGDKTTEPDQTLSADQSGEEDTTGFDAVKNIAFNSKIDSADASELMKKFKDKNFKKGNLNWTSFHPDTLKKIFSDSTASQLSSVNFYCGSTKIEVEGSMKWVPVVIMQIKRNVADPKNTSLLIQQTDYYIGDPSLCPPPVDCKL